MKIYITVLEACILYIVRAFGTSGVDWSSKDFERRTLEPADIFAENKPETAKIRRSTTVVTGSPSVGSRRKQNSKFCNVTDSNENCVNLLA